MREPKLVLAALHGMKQYFAADPEALSLVAQLEKRVAQDEPRPVNTEPEPKPKDEPGPVNTVPKLRSKDIVITPPTGKLHAK